MSGPVQQTIEEKLSKLFSPIHLEVINESHKHSVPRSSETHFKVVVVSKEFEGKTLLEQHRMVNEALKEELSNGVHALSITSRKPEQWSQSQKVSETPNCMGGSKADKK